jgi:hypothetical protein
MMTFADVVIVLGMCNTRAQQSCAASPPPTLRNPQASFLGKKDRFVVVVESQFLVTIICRESCWQGSTQF